MALPELHSDPFRTRAGLTLEELARSARERYNAVLAREAGEFSEAPLDEQQRWIEACEEAAGFLTQEIECRWRDLARRYAKCYYGRDRWAESPSAVRLAFEVVVRHLTNLIFCEDQEDIRDAERYDWRGWMLEQLERRQT